jgi:hypothetical protein
LSEVPDAAVGFAGAEAGAWAGAGVALSTGFVTLCCAQLNSESENNATSDVLDERVLMSLPIISVSWMAVNQYVRADNGFTRECWLFDRSVQRAFCGAIPPNDFREEMTTNSVQFPLALVIGRHTKATTFGIWLSLTCSAVAI